MTGRCNVGPFDKRLRRKRCCGCVQAHAKCDGLTPCSQCLYAGRICTPVATSQPKIQIQGNAVIPHHSCKTSFVVDIPNTLAPTDADRFTTHFFTTFLQRQDFGGCSSIIHDSLHPLIPSSVCLQKAVLALGSLSTELCQSVNGKVASAQALKHYQQAVTSLQIDLSSQTSKEATDQLIWSTLLLGVFELMYDPTGNGFLCHFIHGTSVLLQSQDPRSYAQNGASGLLRLVRIFELSRAVAFWNASFFDKSEWRVAVDLADNHSQKGCDAANGGASFDSVCRLIEQATRLATDVNAIVYSATIDELTPTQSERLKALAKEGIQTHQQLELWHTCLLKPYHCSTGNLASESAITNIGSSDSDPADTGEQPKRPWPVRQRVNSRLLLAQIYYHAASVNMNSIFNHPHFSFIGAGVPFLPPIKIQQHVARMMSLLECALKYTNTVGLLLLWPIRAAGARVESKDQVTRVQAMLEEVERRGFVVARRYHENCVDSWWRPKDLL